MTTNKNDLVWHKVLSKDELHEGRVTSVTCENRTLCMSRLKGEYGALDNKCPHQGGPLGEGSIENGLLRCPWHGWDYDPVGGEFLFMRQLAHAAIEIFQRAKGLASIVLT
jgi:nitrite reductase/ring-hydroxylating ferredoxin subunit